MINITTADGQRFSARNATELVKMLHADSFCQAENDQAWMEQTAKRTVEQVGESVRTNTAVNFIADLIRVGLLKESESDPDAEG